MADVTSRAIAAIGSIKDHKFYDEMQKTEWEQHLIQFYTGVGTCEEICAAQSNYVCPRDWFLHLDRCDIAQAIFPNGRCVEDASPGVPAYLESLNEVLVSKDGKLYPPSCTAPGQGGGVRLCPCVPKDRTRPEPDEPGVKAVQEVLDKMLTERDAHERLEASRGAHEGIEVDEDGAHVSSILAADVKAGRVSFYKGDVGETCHATCKRHHTKCSDRWFKPINKCEVMMAAFPQDKAGQYFKSCGSQFYGHDLPGYQREMDQLLLNNDIDNFPTNCGGRGDNTQRICPCVYKYPHALVTYHSVFNVQSKQYFEWQSRYSVFWHKQVGMSGPITRLLSMGGAWPTNPNPHPVGDHLMQEVPTHIAPQYDYSIDNYVAYNKPLAITHWLQTTKVEEDVIIIMDPDCAYISKVDYQVEEGMPVATSGYYSFKDKKSIEWQIAEHYCKGVCKRYDPIAVPIVIHRKDLEKVAPLWLKYTEDIRRDREGPNKWPIEWNDNKYVVNRIEWVAEMFGYVIAAAHLDLRHEIVDLQMVPSVHKRLTPNVPFLHYHVRIETADHKFWNKGDDHAGQRFPWPVAPGTDAVTTRLLTALHEAYEALGETDRMKKGEWANYFAEWDNPQPQRRRLLESAYALLAHNGSEGPLALGPAEGDVLNYTLQRPAVQVL